MLLTSDEENRTDGLRTEEKHQGSPYECFSLFISHFCLQKLYDIEQVLRLIFFMSRGVTKSVAETLSNIELPNLF